MFSFVYIHIAFVALELKVLTLSVEMDLSKFGNSLSDEAWSLGNPSSKIGNSLGSTRVCSIEIENETLSETPSHVTVPVKHLTHILKIAEYAKAAKKNN